MKDRDDIRRNIPLERATGIQELEKKLFFRNMFIDEHDEEILTVVWNFFAAVNLRWPTAWNTNKTGSILNKSTGFTALVRLMADIYLDIDDIGSVPSVVDFQDYLDRSKLKDDYFVKENFLPGTSGEAGLYKLLAKELKLA